MLALDYKCYLAKYAASYSFLARKMKYRPTAHSREWTMAASLAARQRSATYVADLPLPLLIYLSCFACCSCPNLALISLPTM